MNALSAGMARNPGGYWALAGIVCLAALMYAGTLANQFVWDDHWVIVDNDFIKTAGNLPLLFTRQYLTSPADVNSVRIKSIGSGEFSYRPMVTATYFIDYRLWKLNPFGFHLTGLLLHLANIVLVYLLAARILADKNKALLSAALFSVHPVAAEAVGVITHREDLLAFFFFALSFLFFLRALEGTGRRLICRQAAAITFFLLALFSKEMAVTLPAVLMAYDYFFISGGDTGNFFRQWRARYAGYIIAVLCYCVIRGIVFGNTASGVPAAGLQFPVSAAVIFLSFSRAVYWLLFPPAIHPTIRAGDIQLFLRLGIPWVLFSFLLAAAGLAWAFKTRKKSPVVSFSLLYFFITLLPVSNLAPMINVSASRFLYIPAVGFCLLITALLSRLTARVRAYLFLSLIAGYALITPFKSLMWKNDLFLGLSLVEAYPENAEAHGVLGAEYLKKGLVDKAIVEYRQAVSFDPYRGRYYNGLGLSYYRKGEFDAAVEEYKKAISLEPSSPGFLTNLALACKEKGLYPEAVAYLESALSMDPGFTLALDNLAGIYKETGDIETARRLWERSLELYPGNVNALAGLRTLEQ